MLFQVAYVAVLPRLVEEGQITRMNGRLSASYAAAGIVGPVLAGVLSGRFGPAAAIAVDAASFAVSALGILFVRFHNSTSDVAEPAPRLWANLLVGARFLWQHPVLRSMTVLLTLLLFFGIGLIDLVIFYLKHDLGQPDSTVGYVLSITAIGTIVGSLLVARVRRILGFGMTWIGASIVCGVAIAALGLADTVAAVAVLATIVFGCNAMAGLCSMSLRQEVTPDALLGRVTAAYWTIHSTLGPIGAGVLTAAAGRYGVRPVLMASGVVYVVVASAGVLTPIRQPRPEAVPFPG
jgi:MFS family permease